MFVSLGTDVPSNLTPLNVTCTLSKLDDTSEASDLGFSGGSAVKHLPANAGDVGSIPGSGRSPGEGHGNPLQYSRLGNTKDRGAGWATVHGVARVRDNLVTKPLSPQASDAHNFPENGPLL